MNNTLPSRADLSKGLPPENFFFALIPDRFGVEAWRSGTTYKDYTIPHNSWCVPTSFIMPCIIEGIPIPTQDELFKQCCDYGIYEWIEGIGWKGAKHRLFASFIERYGFVGEFVTNLGPEDVARKLSEGFYVLLRVSPDIRYPDSPEPKSKTGHVVFCFGYETTKHGREFRIHNSAGFASLNSQIDFRVPSARLEQVFSGDATFFRRQIEQSKTPQA